MSSGGMNLGQFQGIDSRGGTEFDENGPNLTEDIGFEIGTTLVGIKGPEEVHSSGMESKYRSISDMISLWHRRWWSTPWPRPRMAKLIEGLF